MTTLNSSTHSFSGLATRFLLLVVLAVFVSEQRAFAQQWTTTGNDIYNANSGKIGVGTSSPPEKLSIIGSLGVSESGGTCCRMTLSTSGAGTVLNHNDNSGIYLQTEGNTRMTIMHTGFVGVGTTTPSSEFHVIGDVTVDGNISAKYQDLAEWVPAASPIAAATVVVLDPDRINTVIPSSGSYDTRVAGVVSAQPGIVLGEAGEGKVKVATTGRVKVRVDATPSPIRTGDLLVTSDREGIAMRSEPMDIGGRKIHQPGTLIGKALEPLAEGEGEILVLLSLQ